MTGLYLQRVTDLDEELTKDQLFSSAGCESDVKSTSCITRETLWLDLWLWEILIPQL
jgi:hypothetical protein